MLNIKSQLPLLNHIKRDFEKEPIHIYTQILTTHFLLLILAMFVFIFILGTLAVQTLISQTSKFNYDNLHYINNETEDFFISLQENLHYVTSNQEIRSSLVFSNQFEKIEEFKISPHTKNYLNYISDMGNDYDLSFCNLNGILRIDSYEPTNIDFDIKSQSWYNEFMTLDISQKVISNSQEPYYLNNMDENAIISYILSIKNYTEDQTIGFLILDIDYEMIEDLYTNKISPTYPIIILDENDELIFHSESLNEDMLEKIIYQNPYFVKEEKITIGKEKYLVSKWHSSYTSWKILSIISLDEQLGPFTELAFIFLPIILIIILLHTLISNNTSKKIIQPINDLITTMKSTRDGYFNQKQLAKANIYEIDELSYTFKSMMEEINHLIDTNQKNNLLKIESQLIALQQKINPHFLFNTLELISGQAIIEDANDTSEMAQKLGNLFRYNLRAPDVLTIQQEMNYFKDYLYLQQIRYNHTLNIFFNIDDSILDYKIPKLTLQPLIENSINHGFGDLPADDNFIKIDGKMNGDNIYIEIIDNGIGIPPTRLNELEDALINDMNNFQCFINRKEHIGIRNVNARLCLYYKIDRCLTIQSRMNEGMKVTITIPIDNKSIETI